MTTIERLDRWKGGGIITGAQHQVLVALVRKERFSVYFELSSLLYLGVLSFTGGLAWTMREYVANLGDLTIVGGLAVIAAAAFTYCFTTALPYSNDEVESPNLAFDYVLYLGCLVMSAAVGYLEYRFQLVQRHNHYLLSLAGVFGAFAYRFDNRFVLSLALSTLAGWAGLQLSAFETFSAALRPTAVAYGAGVGALGLWLHRLGIKRHFLDVYLHLGANVILMAAISGIDDASLWPVWLLGTVLLAAAAILLGLRFREFAFVAYGVLYGYAALSFKLLQEMGSVTGGLVYVVITGTAVIVGLVVMARRFARHE